MIAVCGCKFSLYKTAAAKSIQRLAFAGGNVNSTAACNTCDIDRGETAET